MTGAVGPVGPDHDRAQRTSRIHRPARGPLADTRVPGRAEPAGRNRPQHLRKLAAETAPPPPPPPPRPPPPPPEPAARGPAGAGGGGTTPTNRASGPSASS